MTATLTSFGVLMRQLRGSRRESIKSMAGRLGLSSSYISAAELGHRNPPYEWVERLQTHYDLTDDQTAAFYQAVSDSRVYDTLDVSHLSFRDKRLMYDMALALPGLDDERYRILASWFASSDDAEA